MKVCYLMAGDLVSNGLQEAVYVAQTDHPIWPGKRLVIWKMADGSWSHDALNILQEVGEAKPSTTAERQERLRQALLGAS